MAAEEATAFMEVLSKSPQFKVLTILAEKPHEELTKTEIAQRAKIGRTTLYRVWNDLERMKAISPSRHVGAVTLYRMNPQSPVVQSFLSITKSLTTVTDAVSRIEQLRKLEESAKSIDNRSSRAPWGSLLVVILGPGGCRRAGSFPTRPSSLRGLSNPNARGRRHFERRKRATLSQ